MPRSGIDLYNIKPGGSDQYPPRKTAIPLSTLHEIFNAARIPTTHGGDSMG